MSKFSDPDQIAFLALEGGGGKGIAYLGAIEALEQYWGKSVHEHIKEQGGGISGASAGAITALLLAMGATTDKLKNALSKKGTFDKFFDAPQPGFYRLVDRNNYGTIGTDAPQGEWKEYFQKRAAKLNFETELIGGAFVIGAVLDPLVIPGMLALAGLVMLLSAGLKDTFLKGLAKENPDLAPMLDALQGHTTDYLYNLLWDKGLFPGFAARRYFQGQICNYLDRPLVKRGLIGAQLSFKDFHEITGVDLVVSGTNLTKCRPYLFSSKRTPSFPVADAVAISMSMPIVFKPVRVEEPDPLKADPNGLGGLWVDGGLLNNLPIHAFDDYPASGTANPNLHVLNSRVLGLRLTSPAVIKPQAKDEGILDVTGSFLKQIWETVLYPSEEGMLRTPAEKDQTIEIDTGELSLLNFVPDPPKVKKAIKSGSDSVVNYFSGNQPPPLLRRRR